MVMAMERVIVSIDLRLVTNRHSYLMVTGIVMVIANGQGSWVALILVLVRLRVTRKEERVKSQTQRVKKKE